MDDVCKAANKKEEGNREYLREIIQYEKNSASPFRTLRESVW